MKVQPQINDTITLAADQAEKLRRQIVEQLKRLAAANGQEVVIEYYPARKKQPEMFRRG